MDAGPLCPKKTKKKNPFRKSHLGLPEGGFQIMVTEKNLSAREPDQGIYREKGAETDGEGGSQSEYAGMIIRGVIGAWDVKVGVLEGARMDERNRQRRKAKTKWLSLSVLGHQATMHLKHSINTCPLTRRSSETVAKASVPKGLMWLKAW